MITIIRWAIDYFIHLFSRFVVYFNITALSAESFTTISLEITIKRNPENEQKKAVLFWAKLRWTWACSVQINRNALRRRNFDDLIGKEMKITFQERVSSTNAENAGQPRTSIKTVPKKVQYGNIERNRFRNLEVRINDLRYPPVDINWKKHTEVNEWKHQNKIYLNYFFASTEPRRFMNKAILQKEPM